MSLLFLILVLPGCTNIREVETLTYAEESLTQTGFIGEEQALKTVASTHEVTAFRRSTATSCLIQVEQYPTAKNPIYIVRVAEDQHDHLVVYDQFSVDAYTGRIINQD